MKFFLLFHTILNFKILQAEYTSYERRKKKKIRYKHTIGVLNFKLLSFYFSRIDLFYFYLRGYYMYIY